MKRVYYVKTVQQDAKDADKKYFNDVGVAVLHDNGKTGALFLHMFPGVEYVLFAKSEKGGAGE